MGKSSKHANTAAQCQESSEAQDRMGEKDCISNIFAHKKVLSSPGKLPGSEGDRKLEASDSAINTTPPRKSTEGIANAMAEESTECRSQFEKEVATPSQLMMLIKSQGYKCAISGLDISDPSNAQLDHISPVSAGGNHAVSNLQWVHAKLNRMKGTMSQQEFLELCTAVARHTPCPH